MIGLKPRSRRLKTVVLILFLMAFSLFFPQARSTSGTFQNLVPRTDVYAIFSIPPDEQTWPILDSLGVGWVRLQNQMGESDFNRNIEFFSRVLREGYGLWLTLQHRDRSNVADTALFDASSRGSFPPVDTSKYKDLVRQNVQPLVDSLKSQNKNPADWLVVQFSNEVMPSDVLPPSPKRFFHGTSDEYLGMLALTYRAVKSVDNTIPVAFGAISSGQLEAILEFNTNPNDTLQKIVEWNDRLLREGKFDWADIHLYHKIESIPAKVAWVKERWDGPLAVTEDGGPDESTGVVYTEALQAQELPERINTTLAAGVDRVFWSFLRDLDIPGDRLAQTLGLLASDYRFKPAFSAYRDVILSGPTSVAERTTPRGFRLLQNYPNPFNPETIIHYELRIGNEVELTVYNMLGKRVRILVRGRQPAGSYSVKWNGRNDAGERVSSGVYFYRLKSGTSLVETRKMLLLK
ncbi:MAG: T9SS C-terminal target domain-containing protein [Calditrichaeota bacterium]|nr:MAG: T9SS C-terminal target domain-containing protein [Calditrichota bacterium]